MIPALLLCLAWADAPVDVMIVIETSYGLEQSVSLLNPKALKPGDRAGVVAINERSSQQLQSLTDKRDDVASALRQAASRLAIGAPINSVISVAVARGIEQSANELERRASPDRRRAILVVFGTNDPDVSARITALRSALSSVEARLYAVVIDRTVGRPPGLPPGSIGYRHPVYPVITAQLLEELAKDTGGKIYRRGWDLKEILQEIRR